MPKIFDNVRKVLEVVVLAIFAVIIALTIVQVGMRYFVRSPIHWYDEFVRFLLIWGTLLGCGLATHYNKHVGMDLLLEKFPPKIKLAVVVLIECLIIFLCVFYLYKGSAIALDSIDVKLSTTGISKLYYYGAIPVGAFFWMFFSIEKIYSQIKKGKDVEKV